MSLSPSYHSSYTQELHFEQAIDTRIAKLWASREEGYFKTKDKTSLFWIKLTKPNHTKAIVISNGRIESVWKYQELFHDLFNQGYDIYSYDHRGQGLSDRLVDNHDIGYVHEFDDYISDLAQITLHFNLAHYDQRFILAHSMGAAIATRYLQTHPKHPFNAIAVSAPMYGVNLAWYLKPVAAFYAQLLTAFSATPTYAPGHKAYYSKPFEGNLLSSSALRYTWFRQLYENKPEIKVGGPSTRWVWQSLMACTQCIQQTRQLKLPLLILQAGNEQIVSNQAQNKFIKKLNKTNPFSTLISVESSRHEVLFECDNVRNSALDSISHFFEQHSGK